MTYRIQFATSLAPDATVFASYEAALACILEQFPDEDCWIITDDE